MQKFHRTSQTLREEELNFAVCGDLCNSLAVYLNDVREHFDRFEKTAKDMLSNVDYKGTTTCRRRKKQDNDGDAAAAAAEELNAKERFRVFTFCSITDKVSTVMERRSQVCKDVSTKFSFLNNLRLNEEEYSRCCNNLVSFYQEDLSTDTVGEVQQFRNYIHSKYQGKTDFTHAELHDIIVQDQIHSVFPNLDLAFRIFLAFMLTNVSAERSFSQLKRIKNPYRTTMGQGDIGLSVSTLN